MTMMSISTERRAWKKTFTVSTYSIYLTLAIDTNHEKLLIRPDSLIRPLWDLLIFLLMMEQIILIPF